MRYAILEEATGLPVAYVDLERPPASLEELADHLAAQLGYPDRWELVKAIPELCIGFANVH